MEWAVQLSIQEFASLEDELDHLIMNNHDKVVS